MRKDAVNDETGCIFTKDLLAGQQLVKWPHNGVVVLEY